MGSIEMSKPENEEYAAIEKIMLLDLDKREVCFTYALVRGPKVLRDNRGQAVPIATGLWRQLHKLGQMDMYNAEINGYVKRGEIKELSQEEMKNWDGGEDYNSHCIVLKPSSATTELQIVSNSSLKYK